MIPVAPHAQPPADELEKIWQNPPHVPPQMPPPILPGRPADRPQVPDTETIPHEPAKPQAFPGQPTDRQTKPSIIITPTPEIELPPIYQSDNDSGREKMVATPGLSGKEAASDVPSFAKGRPRYVDETLDEYVDRMMKIGHGDDWKKHAAKGPKSDQNRIRKYGSRHWMQKPKR